jgi:hypothetical protein
MITKIELRSPIPEGGEPSILSCNNIFVIIRNVYTVICYNKIDICVFVNENTLFSLHEHVMMLHAN